MSLPSSWRTPARTSSSRMGKPVDLFQIVPGKERYQPKHKVYWASTSNKTADQYNSVVNILNNPCARRWLEYKGGRVPKDLAYATCYDPPAIKPRPDRYWTVLKDGEHNACYTNCAEAWLIVYTGERFSPRNKWALLYTDRSGR